MELPSSFSTTQLFASYDLQGNLLDEGRYELRPRSKTNPPLEQLEELEEEFLDDRYPLILNIRAASDNQHWVVYNACHFGILDSSFQLIHLERICGPAQGYIPHVLDIDTSHARLLVMNQTDLPPGTSPLSKLDLGPFEVHSMG